MSFYSALQELKNRERPVDLTRIPFPKGLQLLVLAPHPDDFDEVAICLKHFQELSAELKLLVLTGASSGVLDSFVDSPSKESKEAVREREQRLSLEFFGLSPDSVSFMYLPEDSDGELKLERSALGKVEEQFSSFNPHIVSLPYGNDTNSGHQRTFLLFREIASRANQPILGLYHQDPKTVSIRLDAYVPFDKEASTWKAEMLRFHQSQHTRNQATRNYGIDDRILEVNRKVAKGLGLSGPFAEGFQIEIFSNSGEI